MSPRLAALTLALALLACHSSDNGTTGPKPTPGAITADGGSAGAEYTLLVRNASTDSAGRLSLTATGTNVVATTGGPTPDRIPFLAGAAPRVPLHDDAGHVRHLVRESRELRPLIPGARRTAASLAASVHAATAAAVTPNVGDLLTLYATFDSACVIRSNSTRVGRVLAVSQHSIVVADTANPTGTGFSPTEYQYFATTFDTLVYPLDSANFGDPTLPTNSGLSANGGRSILFFTRYVNELTPKTDTNSYYGGFFAGKDLFPTAPDKGQNYPGCAASNQEEIFYLLIPDPAGVLSVPHSDASLTLSTVGTLAHEFQHLINLERRIYVNNASTDETVWLNEGLSHVAEELTFYRSSGLTPGQNIDFPKLQSTPQLHTAWVAFQLENFIRFALYLQHPDTASPYAHNDELSTRGATWSFLRFAADQKGGNQQQTWYALVNSTTAGIPNLRNVFGDPAPLFQNWAAANYADDAVAGTPPSETYPSWNFRSVLPGMISLLNDRRIFPTNQYPLEVVHLAAGQGTSFTLVPGGAKYLRFGVAAGQTARIDFGTLPSTVTTTLIRTK